MNVSSKNARSPLTSGEAAVGSLQGSVLPQTVEQRHHGVALLTALPLRDAVHFTTVHLLQVLGRSAIKHAL